MVINDEPNFRRRVELLVRQIPPGKVMTYGQLAALCGNARAARIVGGIAHFGDPSLPWQRVVNKHGGLASGYPGGRLGQRQELMKEGVKIDQHNRVNIKSLLWTPAMSDDRESLSYHLIMNHSQDRLICVVGQTASGKSRLAMRIAQEWNGEIICADSWTTRRGVDIGTAKPTLKDQALVPHHLLDIIEPDEDFNAALFKAQALTKITEISSRGHLPIMVGGTGLYIDSVIYDYSFSSVGDRKERERLDQLSIPELLNVIKEQGIALEGIDTRNKRRLVRLIQSNGLRPSKKELRANTMLIGIRIESPELSKRIENRVDVMLDAGLESEVRELSKSYGWDCEALKGIGYAQWKEYFFGAENLEDVRKKIVQASVALARRQKTWFQRNNSIHWLANPVEWPEAVGLVTTFLNSDIS